MQQERKVTKTMAAEAATMPDLVFQRVVDYIHDPRDLAAASLVCRRWYAIDSSSRKHVTVALCYATTPQALDTRFPSLESLKLKAKPRAAMFDLIPEDWGGHVGPWVEEMARSFQRLKAVHFRRMIVRDSDIELLAKWRGKDLVELKIDRCSGFSTDGLKHIGWFCKNLTTLSLEDSNIDERDGKWLHELALNNKNLKTLNFYLIELSKVDVQDLELIARNCPSLTSVKISECEILDLGGFFRTAVALQEFGGGSFNAKPEEYSSISFPPRVSSLGLRYMGQNEMPFVFPVASLLTRLDLLYALLDTEDHCLLIQKCPNLEVLETRNVIGDIGLEVLGNCCKKLRRLRIEPGSDEQGMFNEGGRVTHAGLIALAQGCPELEYLAVYVSDITNAALEFIGTFLKNLCDFRLVLLDQEERISELPLDNGVRALLQGCNKLRRFALYLRPGGLTNTGLGYIGMYTPNVRWMLLGYVGESDAGLLEFSRGCPSLQRLEIRGCIFSEHALAVAALQLTSLRYLWVQGYPASETGHDLLAMARPFWNIELIPARQVIEGEAVVREDPAHILAYYSLVGQRTDFPDTVVPLEPPGLLNE